VAFVKGEKIGKNEVSWVAGRQGGERKGPLNLRTIVLSGGVDRFCLGGAFVLEGRG